MLCLHARTPKDWHTGPRDPHAQRPEPDGIRRCPVRRSREQEWASNFWTSMRTGTKPLALDRGAFANWAETSVSPGGYARHDREGLSSGAPIPAHLAAKGYVRDLAWRRPAAFFARPDDSHGRSVHCCAQS